MSKSILGTREKNVNMHNEVNHIVVNDLKPSYVGGIVVVPNNYYQEDNLEGRPTLLDYSLQAYLVQNVEQIKHVSSKGDPSGLPLSN